MIREFYCARISIQIRHGRSLKFARLQFNNMAKRVSIPEMADNILLRAYFWDEVPIPQSE